MVRLRGVLYLARIPDTLSLIALRRPQAVPQRI